MVSDADKRSILASVARSCQRTSNSGQSRQVASERTKVDVEKTALEGARRQLGLDTGKNLQAMTDQLARHVAAGLRPRLQKAGIT